MEQVSDYLMFAFLAILSYIGAGVGGFHWGRLRGFNEGLEQGQKLRGPKVTGPSETIVERRERKEIPKPSIHTSKPQYGTVRKEEDDDSNAT